jgi:plasmid stabilization system protein ParE
LLITRDDGVAAERIVEQIRATIRVLAELPDPRHEGIVEGTYERMVSRRPYVIVYRLDLGSTVQLIILRVPCSSQERSEDRY